MKRLFLIKSHPPVRKPLLSGAFCFALLFFILLTAPRGLSQHGTAQTAEAPPVPRTVLFAIATIKPNKGNNGWKMEFTPDGFTARGVMLRQVIQEAYAVYEEDRLNGGPDWLTSEKFDIEAKIDTEDATGWRDFGLDQRRLMLQRLLKDRFGLEVHHETKVLPVYTLVLAKTGPKLQESKPENFYHGRIKGMDGLITKSGRGRLEAQDISMTALANMLHSSVGRTVVNETGLQSRYDLSLHWTPDDASSVASAESNQEMTQDFSGPSIFTAVQEQLGLKLEQTKSPLDTITIDHVEHPSEN